MQYFLEFIFWIKLYMFRTFPLSIIRSFTMYTQELYMSYSFAGNLQAGSGRSVEWKTPDDGQRNCRNIYSLIQK